VHRLARIVFPYYWEVVSLAAAVGEWILACWALGAPGSPAVHLTALALLFGLNRLAAEGYEREDAAAPVRHRVGGTVLAFGFSCAGGAGGLLGAALLWALVVRAGGLSAQAGTVLLVPHQWLGSDFAAIGWTGALAGFGLVLHGFLRGYRALEVVRIEVTLPRLPAGLDGFRVVQLSDLHLGPIADRAALRGAFDAALRERPDLIVVTGDITDTERMDLDAWLPELRRLQAPHGVMAILGNHDDEVGLDRVEAGLRATTDWTVLRDAVRRVETPGGTLWVAGLEFRPTPHEGDAVEALAAGIPDDAPALLLIHHPTAFAAARAAGLPLTLAGHTHGGQIAVPMAPRWNVARLLMTPYDAGTFVEDGCVLHVNRGLGASGQRVRIGAPREVTLLTLRRPETASRVGGGASV
jgi:hypothetical protein